MMHGIISNLITSDRFFHQLHQSLRVKGEKKRVRSSQMEVHTPLLQFMTIIKNSKKQKKHAPVVSVGARSIIES
jgi:hypothetical protein